MSNGIAPTLFDFVDELAERIRTDELSRDERIEQDSTAITFCESLFDQFFGDLGLNISGFGSPEKTLAGTHAEELREDSSEESAQKRLVITHYEAFCDMYDDLQTDYGGEVVGLTYETFHTDYLLDLLDAVGAWAAGMGYAELSVRIGQAREGYVDAIESSAWLMRTTKSGSVWRR